jgi:hypothetical protein
MTIFFDYQHARTQTNLSSRPKRTRISFIAGTPKPTYAAFRKESRMKFANATNLNRKSGVAQWRDLLFFFFIPSHPLGAPFAPISCGGLWR